MVMVGNLIWMSCRLLDADFNETLELRLWLLAPTQERVQQRSLNPTQYKVYRNKQPEEITMKKKLNKNEKWIK